MLYSTLHHLPPLRFLSVGGCCGIEPWAVATLTLPVRRSKHSAGAHPSFTVINCFQFYILIDALIDFSVVFSLIDREAHSLTYLLVEFLNN